VKNAAVGLRAHSGWSAMVAVCVEKGGPVVLHRERVHLVKVFNYSFRQPYHTAAKLPLAEGRAFISQVRAEARRLAYRAIRDMESELERAGYKLSRGALLLTAGRPLPELENILASHALIHTADGELFRECLLHASERCGLAMKRIKERELLEQAAKALRVPGLKLLKRVAEMGSPFGAPWTQDEKFATLAAWLALHPSDKGSRKTANKE
jgi:hypothetical protein